MKQRFLGNRTGLLISAVMTAGLLNGCGSYQPIDASAQTGGSISVQLAEREPAEHEAAKKEAAESGALEEAELQAFSKGPGETGAQVTERSAAPEAETAAETAAAIIYEDRDETVYVQTNGVNVRTSPEVINGSGENAGNLAHVAMAGDSYHRTSYSDGFSKVEKDGQTYYISSEYLSVNPPETAAQASAAASDGGSGTSYENGAQIGLDSSWKYADFAAINSGKAVLYKAQNDRKQKIIAVNAGHGTEGGTSVKTWCHPDKTPKVTGGTTSAGATKAVAVSSGMTFTDGTPEKKVTLRMAQILKEKLLAEGYDVLMLRDGEDVQLDNVARTVIANNVADCHISLHWDGDGLSTIKGCFYMSVPDAVKSMEPVASHWQEHERLGDCLIAGLKAQGMKIWGSNPLDMDLTQTSYSTIPSVDIELGNQCSNHDDGILTQEADGLVAGINSFFGF